ncbi:MAG TPA: hypothetical protein VGF40_14545 [Thermoanaerobaculia bacterium]
MIRTAPFCALVLAAASLAFAGEPPAAAAPAEPEEIAIRRDAAPPPPPLDVPLPAGNAVDGNLEVVVRRAPRASDPALTDALQDLRWMLGRWEFRQESAEGRPQDAGRVTGKAGPGGNSIILETVVTEGPAVGFAIIEVIAPARGGRGFEVYTFASDATPPTIASASFDGASLAFRRTADAEGRTTTEVTFERVTERLSRRTFTPMTDERTFTPMTDEGTAGALVTMSLRRM